MDSVTIARLKAEVSELIQAQEYELAYSALVPACDDARTDIALWSALASVCHARSDLPGVIRSCRRIISLCPDHAEALFNLGVALVSEGQYGEAASCLQRVLELEPDYADAHDQLGQLLELQGDGTGARRHYSLAVRSPQARPEHFQRLAGNQVKAHSLELAEANFLTALSMDNSDPRVCMELGRVQCELGKMTEAAATFESVLAINPGNKYARYWLAAARDIKGMNAGKCLGVSMLFDKAAAGFDAKLVTSLGYRTPWQIGDLMRKYSKARGQLDILDLGCGTGLCAEALGELAGRMVGVDLSQNMLDLASDRGGYSELVRGEIVEVMQRDEHRYELVVAADVFIYVGALERVFPACFQVLKPGGMLVFSIEVSEAADWNLRASGRYAHSNDYIEQLALQNGFTQLAQEDIDLRLEYGKMLPGRLYLFRKPSA